ncbi:hypothetical protein E2562_011526 [Oryza meyeriana var. granulata]|uniref:protein-serine/threonine phosphatase n=1 Tax=Oryza meyeriana var. granulata TaxID=110450 RepID=A0A6G1D2C5_9ORYZ|nr:hypothetical protein E2562_011526 [Oryza meyeriana var. granulata]
MVQGTPRPADQIGDAYLKPYVTTVPEVTVTDRSDDDGCLILASDGLWDVVSNEAASGAGLPPPWQAAMVRRGGSVADQTGPRAPQFRQHLRRHR